MSVSCNS